MKKVIVLILISLLVLGCSKKEELIDTSFYFYKKENLSRYLKYKEKNPTLSDKDIIIRVNIGLDKEFYSDVKRAQEADYIHVLVNKYRYLEPSFIPTNLAIVNPNFSKGTRLLVDVVRVNFEKMASDMKLEGLNIRLISAYRSFAYQKVLYDNYVLKENEKEADTYSARPGHSEHQTGLAIDLDNVRKNYNDFDKTKEFEWMQLNAHKYGFILRYPKDKEHITGYIYEPWHYRYVGTKIAKIIHKENITFDEYYYQEIEKGR